MYYFFLQSSPTAANDFSCIAEQNATQNVQVATQKTQFVSQYWHSVFTKQVQYLQCQIAGRYRSLDSIEHTVCHYTLLTSILCRGLLS